MKILVLGSTGLLGSAFRTIHQEYSQHKWEFFNHHEAGERTCYWDFSSPSPDAVINCAAVVGGIKMNREHPVELFTQNMNINMNVFYGAQKNNIPKVIAFSSACAMPDVYPMHEDMLQDGRPFENNFAYGYAKRMVDVMVKAYNQQYGFKWLTIIPTSLYGPHDNFNLENGHFIAALIHKAYRIKQEGGKLTVWGTGKPLRELLYAEDLARTIVRFLEADNLQYDKYIVSSGQEVSVKDVANLIAEEMGLEVEFDISKPDGQFRKPTDTQRLKEQFNDIQFTDYKEGIRNTIKWFLENYPKVRC